MNHDLVGLPIEDQLSALEKHIGDQDHTVTGLTGRGWLSVEIVLTRWEGERGWKLMLRCVWMVWIVFRKSLESPWVRKDSE